MRTTLEVLGKRSMAARKMEGIPVLICGLGKVGFPLMQLLHQDGAAVSVWEPALEGTADEQLEQFWSKADENGAAIDQSHLATLKALRKSIFSNEADALST